METLNATDFKAKCLGVLDDVARTGDVVTITKRGKPVARLIPYTAESTGVFPQDQLKGSVRILEDIVSSPWAADDWNAVRGQV